MSKGAGSRVHRDANRRGRQADSRRTGLATTPWPSRAGFIVGGIDVHRNRLALADDIQFAEHIPRPAAEGNLTPFRTDIDAVLQVCQRNGSEENGSLCHDVDVTERDRRLRYVHSGRVGSTGVCAVPDRCGLGSRTTGPDLLADILTDDQSRSVSTSQPPTAPASNSSPEDRTDATVRCCRRRPLSSELRFRWRRLTDV